MPAKPWPEPGSTRCYSNDNIRDYTAQPRLPTELLRNWQRAHSLGPWSQGAREPAAPGASREPLGRPAVFWDLRRGWQLREAGEGPDEPRRSGWI